MQAQFRYDAKADYGARVFGETEKTGRQGSEPPRDAGLARLYQQLAQSALNL